MDQKTGAARDCFVIPFVKCVIFLINACFFFCSAFPPLFVKVVLFLSVMENLAFCPAAIMEAFAKNVSANPDTLTLKDLLCILKVYSYLNYDLKHQRQQ